MTEVMKYPVKEIIYIERDPALARKWSSTFGFTGSKTFSHITVMHSDI